MPRNLPITLRIAGLWLIYSAWASVTGWVLSSLGQLNTLGCGLSFIPLGLSAFWWWRLTRPAHPRGSLARIALRRLRTSPACAVWLAVTVVAFTGGLLNPPSNYDALTYRIPRLLYWLQEGGWHWIDSLNFRMDIAGTGFEWMSLPLVLFTSSDRALFLLNFIPFLLLPGLFFTAAVGLGIHPRHARWWMWVWPFSYGIVLQAASIGNDMVGAAFALSSLAFTMAARKGNSRCFLFFSALAAALMTSIKVTMLPLCLPLAIPWVWVAWERLGPPKAITLAACSAILLIPASFAPIAALCAHHTGTWSGNPGNRHDIEVARPLAGVIGNGMDFTIGTVAPPVFPGSQNAMAFVTKATKDSELIQWTKSNYANYHLRLPSELPSEEGSGIGIGVTILGLLWLAAKAPKRALPIRSGKKIGIWVCIATLVATLVFIAKVGGNAAPRLMLPFTPFFLLAILLVARRSSHQMLPGRLMLVPALLILPALCLNPNRPLLPADWIGSIPGLPSGLRSRIDRVFGAYSQRGNILAPMAAKLPPGDTVGFAGELDHSPMGLFRPFGSRRVIEVTPKTIDDLEWVVGTARGIEQRLGVSAAEWTNQGAFGLTAELPLTSRASTGEEIWQLYHRTN